MSPIKDSSIYILDKIYYINAKSVCLNNAGPGVLATTLHDHSSRAGLVLAMTMTGRLERNWKMTAPAVFLDVRVSNLPMNSRKEVIFLNHYFLKSITLSTSTICISRYLVYFCRMLSVCTRLFIQTHGAMPQMALINQKVVSLELLEKSVTWF